MILPRLAALYVRFLALFSKIAVEGNGLYEKPAIYVTWHRQEVLMIYLQRDRGLCGLVSKSKDGEYMARILRHFGYRLIRGSSSSGGSEALRALVKAGRQGLPLAITPDGPKGPIFKVHPGTIYIAKKTGLPVLPCASAYSRKLVFKNWDRYQFPLPFGRLQAVYGEPFFVKEYDDIEAKCAELEAILNALTARAEALINN
jgi:lysophospholipid acyltransferase (LPLAT)-like uncharacterized protein